MDKNAIIRNILNPGLVAVIRADGKERAVKIANACMEGGITALEITFTVPGAAEVIKELVHNFGAHNNMSIGAGTVLDSETARTAILAGAQYVVSPCINMETIKLCNRYKVPVLPGAMTIKEVIEAMEAGADIVKVFPGELLGPAFIKAVKGPLPHAQLMPTGGVGKENVSQWIKAGAVAVGVGGSLTAGAKTGDYQAITHTAKELIELIKEAKEV